MHCSQAASCKEQQVGYLHVVLHWYMMVLVPNCHSLILVDKHCKRQWDGSQAPQTLCHPQLLLHACEPVTRYVNVLPSALQFSESGT